MLSKEFLNERGRNSSDEFAVDPNAKPAEIPAWLKKAGTWLGNKIGLKEPVALPDYTASNQQDAASRSGYTGIDPVQRANAGMAPATQQEINRYMRDNPAVVGGLTDRNGNPIASGGAHEVERAARAAAPRRGADFDFDAEVGAVDPAVIGNRFKTPRELGFQPGGSTTPSGGKPGESRQAQAAASTGAGEYPFGTFNNDMAADKSKISEMNRILELSGLLKSSEFLNEAPAVPAQPATAAPVAANPAGQQPFKPTQVMDPQQAAAANKAAQEFIQGLMAQLQQIKPVAESKKLDENWFTDKIAAATTWVQQKLKENPLIEIGLRFLPVTSTVLAITDVIGAIKGGNLTDATRMMANLIPGGQQLAQAVGVGQAVASGDVTGAVQTAASAAGLKDVASGISAGQVAQAVAETTELNRILKLSGMEFIAEDSTKSITVQRGDTLSRIARDNSTTVDAILKLNNIANPDRIYPGDVIKVPGETGGDPDGRTKRQGAGQSDQPEKRTRTTTSTGNAKIAMEFFLEQGWTPEQAAGLVANLQAESYDRLDPAALGDKGRGYGIAQWHGPRQKKFEEIIGVPLKGSSLENQLKFVQWELTNPESAERSAGTRLKSAKTAADAAAVIDEFYERSSGIHRQRRIAKAEALLTAVA